MSATSATNNTVFIVEIDYDDEIVFDNEDEAYRRAAYAHDMLTDVTLYKITENQSYYYDWKIGEWVIC